MWNWSSGLLCKTRGVYKLNFGYVLESDTEIAILNEGFLEDKTADHDWIQRVQYMLCKTVWRFMDQSPELWRTNHP